MADDIGKRATTETGMAAPEPGGLSRRRLLKGAAATAGLAAGSGVIEGFPTIWAQNIRDVTLVHTGQSYSTIIDIARQATEDLGFTVEMAVTDHAGLINRVTTQPDSVDVADAEVWQTALIAPRGVWQGIDVSRIDLWDQVTPIYVQGTFEGKEISRQGISPYEIMYLADREATAFHDGPTGWATLLPGVYNADTLGIRPDLIGRPVESWAELIEPEFAGKAALQDIPSIGIIDAAMAFEAAGEITYADKGNMTREEIDATIAKLIELKRAGHWRALWSTFDQSVNLMASGEVVIQSMWSPAVTAVRARGIDVEYQPLNEGFRGWGNGLALMRHLDGIKLDAAYEYLNWYISGWVGGFIAKQGYYISIPELANAHLTPNEWGYWYEGTAATEPITDPYGTQTDAVGAVRDGGSYVDRFSKIAVWNTVMDESTYMLRKWNEFKAA